MTSEAVSLGGGSRPRIVRSVGRYWPELLAAIVLIQSASAAFLAQRYQLAGHIPWTDYYILWLIPGAAVFIVMFCIWLWRLNRSGEEHPSKVIFEKLRSMDGRIYVEFIVPIVVMAPFMASYTTFKVLLEDFTNFGADPALFRIDGIFGIQPWQISHALIGPLGTLVLDRMYYSWFLVTQLMLIGILFVPALARQRAQVLLTFVLSWILLGSVVAILVPSVGPCYYGKLHQPDVYADLMERLSAINQTNHLNALGVQQRLWADHTRDLLGLGSGISAMPSMHVSVATITALLLRRLGLGWLGLIWVTCIWIGSFHLGWHYASDGIVSIVGTAALWKGCSYLLGQTNELNRANGARALPSTDPEPAVP